jgi:hypothetical protein
MKGRTREKEREREREGGREKYVMKCEVLDVKDVCADNLQNNSLSYIAS